MGIGGASGNKRQDRDAKKVIHVTVSRKGDNTYLRWNVPIIFVPGVMGSRLEFPAANERWNPDNNWDMLHWIRISAERQRLEMHHLQPAYVMTDRTKEELEDNEKNFGWEGLAWKFYVPFLQFLKKQQFRLAEAPIYAVGYDWRQDIGFLGDFLARKIDQILANENAQHAIIITHSMGGLISRAALKAKKDFSQKILGVIHVVQPAAGAVAAYRRFFTGAVSHLDGGFPLSVIMGNTSKKYTSIMSGLTGPMQLMPGNLYRDRENQPWIQLVKNGNKATGWPKNNVFELYADKHSPPGLLEHGSYNTGEGLTIRNDILSRITEAEAYHNWIGDYKHENTYSIFSTGVETDMAVLFNPSTPPQEGKWENRGILPIRRQEGDGTVPDTSAAILFTNQTENCDGIPKDEISESANQCGIHGVEHSEAFNNNNVRSTVVSWINRILFEKISERKHI